MTKLQARQAVATFGFLAGGLQYAIDELYTFGVLIFGRRVACASLSKGRIVRPDDLSNEASPNTVHRSGLAIHPTGTMGVPVASGLPGVHMELSECRSEPRW